MVAAAVPAPRRRRRQVNLPGLTRAGRRRHKIVRVVKLARHVGTVVSAVSFAADVWSEMNSIKKPGQSGATER
jgi:ribosomal protein L18E